MTSRRTVTHFRRWQRIGHAWRRIDMVVDIVYRRGGAWWLAGRDRIASTKWWRVRKETR